MLRPIVRHPLSRSAARVLLALAALLASSSAFARFEWRDVVQRVAIEPGGDVVVDDTRTLWTDEDFGEAFLCIPLEPGEALELLGGSGPVGPGPAGRALSQPCEDGSGGTEMVVRLDRRVQERRVRFVYRLRGTVDAHGDVVEWYWNVIRSDHPPIRGYRLTVEPPGGMAAPYDAFVHRYTNLEEPTVRLSPARDRLEVDFDRIPQDVPLEIRWLMDPGLFTVRGSGARLEALLQDEARIAGVQVRDRAVARVRSSPWWGLLPLAGVLWLAWGIGRAWRRHGREPDLPQMKYPFEPPSDLPPAAVIALRMQNFNASGMSNAFRATIMDLARRGYGEFAGNERRFEMVLHPGADPTPLEPFERSVLDFLRDAARSSRGDDHHLEFGEFKRYAEKRLSGFMKRWAGSVRAWVEARFGAPLVTAESRAATRGWAGAAVLVAIGCGVLVFLLSGLAMAFAIGGAALAVTAAVVAGAALPSWRPEVAREVYGWNGFQRTLADYTRMRDAPLDFYRLWDRYFVYAAAMGIAERYLRALRRAAPEAGVDPNTLTRSAAWMGPHVAASGDIASFSRSVTALSSALSAASASASSGGSVAGGGGGGGAGGSSGGR